MKSGKHYGQQFQWDNQGLSWHHSVNGNHYWDHHKHGSEIQQERAYMKLLMNLDTDFRTMDGSNNNPDTPYLGTTNSTLLRIAPSDYSDGIGSPAGQDRPSAREISNEIFNQDTSSPDPGGASAMFWLWGQFLDHDIDLSITGNEAFHIVVPSDDAYFIPDSIIPLTRTIYDDSTGVRQQINSITPYIDASVIYGSDDARASYLRTYEDGLLKTSEGNLLPFNEAGFDNAGGPSDSLFLSGDVRANENIGLTSMHTVFVREHNYWAEKLAKQFPTHSDEEIYQHAKMMVEAEIQAITYNEFLPQLLGENALPEYTGYQPWVNPQIANIFSTAAYRLGHTLLGTTIFRYNEDGTPIDDGHLALREAFFAPYQITAQGEIDSIIRGFAASHSESVDAKIVDDVRNFLFGDPGMGGFDLAALNIQRGRDHGLPDYNTAREAYGLDPVNSFADITSDVGMQQVLASLYNDVNNIDVFVGGLLEDPMGDSMLGELFHTIVLDQFVRLRAGDRMWYEERLPEELVNMVNDTSLSDILLRNTDIDYLQDNVFLDYNRLASTDGQDHLLGTEGNDLLISLKANDIIEGLDGNDELFGGKGNDLLLGGQGDDRMTGESGHDTFIIKENEGYDVITDFKPGEDNIDLQDYNLTPQDLALAIQQVGADTLITLSPTSSLMLEDVNLLQLNQSDFLL